MRIPGVDGYRLDDTFGFDRGAIQIGVIREADGQAVGTASGNVADRLIREARSIALMDHERRLARVAESG
jgi:hypothetical protein